MRFDGLGLKILERAIFAFWVALMLIMIVHFGNLHQGKTEAPGKPYENSNGGITDYGSPSYPGGRYLL